MFMFTFTSTLNFYFHFYVYLNFNLLGGAEAYTEVMPIVREGPGMVHIF